MVIKNLENKIKLVLIICSLFLAGCIIIYISSIWTARTMVSDAHKKVYVLDGLPKVSSTKLQKLDREKTVINMYAAGHPIDEIWRASGFKSRSSVFRILNKHGIKLNRGNHSGPIKKKNEEDTSKDVNKS